MTRRFEREKTRKGWGDGLVDLGASRKDVVVLVGDNTTSTNVDGFAERWPGRFYQMGIAEQHMVNTAAGLSLFGKIPYYVTYSAFGVGRVVDQLRVTVGYSHLNVKIGGGHSGLSVGPDGATHQMMEDLAIVTALPGFTVLCPADYWQTRKAVAAAAEIDGPVYIRFGREAVPVVTTEEDPFEVGPAQRMADGDDVTLIATGAMVAEALQAHDMLAEQGIAARVLNLHTLKPLDEDAIIAAARKTGRIVTVEEHQIHGGLHALVSQVVARRHPVTVQPVAVMDRWGRSGDADALLDQYGLRAENIVARVREMIPQGG